MPEYTAPSISYGESNIAQLRDELQSEMSKVADFDRSSDGMKSLFDKVCAICENFFDTAVIESREQTAELFKLYDTALTQRSVLSAMIHSASTVGTHGSALVDGKPDTSMQAQRSFRTVTKKDISYTEPTTPIPNAELWFETLLARQKKIEI